MVPMCTQTTNPHSWDAHEKLQLKLNWTQHIWSIIVFKSPSRARPGHATHIRQWSLHWWSWRSAFPCWKPHRWVPTRPRPETPCGSCWTWLSSHHCLPADREHRWQFRPGTDSLPMSFQGVGVRGWGVRVEVRERKQVGWSRRIQMAN